MYQPIIQSLLNAEVIDLFTIYAHSESNFVPLTSVSAYYRREYNTTDLKEFGSDLRLGAPETR